MLKRPTPDAGAFMKLHQFLKTRKLKRPEWFGVIVFGLLETPEDYNGFPLHGIFWLCDVFNNYDEAQKFADEIIVNTGMTHVKILSLCDSDLLTIGVDSSKTRTVIDTKKKNVVDAVERQNVKERQIEKEDEERMREIIAEEQFKMNDSQSEVHYGHVWMRYIQNRTIREHTEKSVKEYQKLEQERLKELHKLHEMNPEYEKTWLPIFTNFRKRLDEKAAADQIENLWLMYRQEVFPEVWK